MGFNDRILILLWVEDLRVNVTLLKITNNFKVNKGVMHGSVRAMSCTKDYDKSNHEHKKYDKKKTLKQNKDNNSIYLIRLLRGLNKLIYLKHSEQCLEHGKHCTI